MKNIEQYKRRFYKLMESTIGDVKPLISEQPERPVPTPTPNPAYSNNTVPQGQPVQPVPQGQPVSQGQPGPAEHPTVPNPAFSNQSNKGYLGRALSVHKVSAGENLTSIAKKYNVTVDEILKSNPQIKDKNMIKVNQMINIEKY